MSEEPPQQPESHEPSTKIMKLADASEGLINDLMGRFNSSKQSRKRKQQFMNSHEAYFELGRIEYNIMKTINIHLPRVYSFTEYQHMRGVLLKAREYLLWYEYPYRADFITRLMESFDQNNLFIPESTFVYLEGMGSFSISTGERFIYVPEKLLSHGRYRPVPVVPPEGATPAQIQAAADMIDIYCSLVSPGLTFSYIADEVLNNPIGTRAMTFNLNLQRGWFTEKAVIGSKIIHPMSSERRQVIAGTRDWLQPLAGSSIENYFQVDDTMIGEWNTVMSDLAIRFPMKLGFPRGEVGSLAQGLKVTMIESGQIDKALMYNNDSVQAPGHVNVRALVFRYRLERQLAAKAWPTPIIPYPERSHYVLNFGDTGNLNQSINSNAPQSTHVGIINWIKSSVKPKKN